MKKSKFTMQKSMLPVLILLMAMGCSKHAEELNAKRAIKVVTELPSRRLFRESLVVQGTVASKNNARLSALVPGAIESMLVDEGDSVTKGQALFQTDKLNLESKVRIEQDNLKVAAASVAEAEAGLQEAQAIFEKTQTDHERYKKLYHEEKAITLDSLEKMETAFKRADAGLTHAKALVDLAHAREAQARSSLSIAEKQLADSLIQAPMEGVVTRRILDRGEFAGAGTVVLNLDDLNVLEVVFVLSSEYYDRVATNKTYVTFSSDAQESGKAQVYFKSPSVQPVTRTFECKAYLPSSANFAPGMLLNLSVVFGERMGLGVPSPAISLREGRSVVFTVDQDKAVIHTIHAGWADNGFTELLEADSLEKIPIIVEGQAFLNDQDPVRLN